MAKTKSIQIPDDIVIFEDAEGNIISNDPRFHALQTLGLVDAAGNPAGVSLSESQPAEAEARAAEASGAEVQTKVAPATKNPEPEESDDDEELETEDEDEADEVEDYSGYKGKELAAIAKERGVEFSGRKAGEVRADLMALDAESTEDDDESDDEDDESEDDTEE